MDVSPLILQNEFQSVGTPRLLSFKYTPFPSNILIPTAPVIICCSINDKDFSKQSSGTIVSGFKKRMYLPVVFSKPILLALENPLFSSNQIKRTSGNLFKKNFLLSSVELLSTTKISALIF